MYNRIKAEFFCRLKGLVPVAKVISFGIQQETKLSVTNHTPITIVAASGSVFGGKYTLQKNGT